ncbi:MAG: MFS transporter [Gammaproteobacteria bacterium]|nr:MFS transporter [Gammaproteobacteria bacterium]
MPQRLENRYAATLSGVITLRMLGLFLILPVFMVLAVDVPGYSPVAAGLAVGAYGLTQALLQQPFGWLSDRWGRKPVLLLGLALFALGGVVAALAETMTALIAGRALQGCGAIAGVAMALAADVTRPERRPVIMAIIGIGIGGAFLLSMALSVPLATLLGLEGLFWLTALLAVLGMALVLTLPTPPLPEPEVDTEGSAAALPVWLLALSVFLLHGAMTLLFVILPPMLVNDFGLALPQHWKLYVPTMLASVIVLFPLLRRVGRKLGEHRMIPWAFVAIAFSMALIPFSSAWAVLGLLVTVYFLGFNLLEAGMPALLSRITGSRGRGRRMGLYSTFQFLGAFFGGVSGGLLLSAFGGPSALLSAGVVCGVWGLLLRAFSTRFFPTGSTV